MAANFELASGKAGYWKAREDYRNEAGFLQIEEQQANAYMLRTLRYPLSRAAQAKIVSALKAYCRKQPDGYRDAPEFTARAGFVDECRVLANVFWVANPHYDQTNEGYAAYEFRGVLGTLRFYPSVFQIDGRECPIFVLDEQGILRSLGISLDYFGAITGIVETGAFQKSLKKLDAEIVQLWQRRKSALSASVVLQSLDFKRWKPANDGCYSVWINGDYRVHRKGERASNSWTAEQIGYHKQMGHG